MEVGDILRCHPRVSVFVPLSSQCAFEIHRLSFGLFRQDRSLPVIPRDLHCTEIHEDTTGALDTAKIQEGTSSDLSAHSPSSRRPDKRQEGCTGKLGISR
jgi:hypothetical protein